MKKQLLTVILLAMMLVPMISACHWEPEPTPVTVTVMKNTFRKTYLAFYWNGFQWKHNDNRLIEVIDGRTYVTYQLPQFSLP